MKRILTLCLMLVLFVSQASALHLGKKTTSRMIVFPLNPALDTGKYATQIWPDSGDVITFAAGADTGNTSSQAIYSARTGATVTAAGLAAIGVRADSIGTNTPIFVFADSGRILNGGTTTRELTIQVRLWRLGCPFTTNAVFTIYADTLLDNVATIGGTSQTARDLGASVLLSSGTGTGQLNFTSGVVQADAAKIGGQTASAAGTITFPSTLASTTNITFATGVNVNTVSTGAIENADFASQPAVNVTVVDGVALGTHGAGYFPSDLRQVAGGAVPTPNVTGVPIVDLKYIMGTQTDTTGASGRLAVNMRYVANQLCAASAGVTFPSSIASPTNITSASGVSLAADQAVNVTKIDGSAWSSHATGMVPADMRDVAGVAVSTTTAQFGVNSVKIGNTTQTGLDLGAYVPAIFDTVLLVNGSRVGCKAKWYRNADVDSLRIFSRDGTTLLQVSKFYHVGGSPGDAPNDTSKTTTGP